MTGAGVGEGDIRAAHDRIGSHLHRTTLLPSPRLSRLADSPVWLKAENLQATGSFKARGALNFLLQLTSDGRRRGVVTASAGNHGQAVAWAAARIGIPSTIVLPVDAVAVKVERTRAWGASVLLHGQGYDDAHAHAEDLAREMGAIYVPAFDHPAVIAGQATVALDILDERPEIHTLVVPVGGGGLIAGVALAAASHPSHPRVVGVQSERTSAMYDALRAGALTPVATPPTLADGLAGETCQTTLDICRSLGITVDLVPERALLPAIRATLVQDHLAIEGSAAVAVAAIEQGTVALGAGPIALILSGGNVDPGVLSRALAAG